MLSRFLFDPGRLVATPAALTALSDSGQRAADFLERHICGDWGELSPQDKAANTLALVSGERLLSSYQTSLQSRRIPHRLYLPSSRFHIGSFLYKFI